MTDTTPHSNGHGDVSKIPAEILGGLGLRGGTVAPPAPTTAADASTEDVLRLLDTPDTEPESDRGFLRDTLTAITAARDEARRDLDAARREAVEAREARNAADARAREAGERASAFRLEHRRDLTTIGEALREEAERREWCGEYEEVCSRVAGHLTLSDAWEEATLRSREYVVDVPVITWVSVPVSCRDEDEALDYARSSWEDYMDRDSLTFTRSEYHEEDVTEG